MSSSAASAPSRSKKRKRPNAAGDEDPYLEECKKVLASLNKDDTKEDNFDVFGK